MVVSGCLPGGQCLGIFGFLWLQSIFFLPPIKENKRNEKKEERKKSNFETK